MIAFMYLIVIVRARCAAKSVDTLLSHYTTYTTCVDCVLTVLCKNVLMQCCILLAVQLYCFLLCLNMQAVLQNQLWN